MSEQRIHSTPCTVLGILALLFVISCNPPDEFGHDYDRWSSSDPLAMPHRVRSAAYKQGNLVLNSSFEIGKVKRFDSLTLSTSIDAWDILGEHVSWVTDSLGTEIDSVEFSGLHYIRIERQNASETEYFGEGVLSDYIKVLPGNYALTLRVNLMDVVNPKSRLGTGIYDAIDIKVLYYDRNKVQLKGEFYDPNLDQYIDNNFKGASFAGLETIDSTGWITIQGKTADFPFQDGDLQDNAKFVRIFIGLKGMGTMLVDDVDFRFTRYNLTALERIEPYFDTTLAKQVLIQPTPQEIKVLQSLTYYRPFYEDNFPIILLPNKSDPLVYESALLLEEQIKQLIARYTELEETQIPGLIHQSIKPFELGGALVFSIGETFLSKQWQKELPYADIKDKERGYFIYSRNDQNHIILIDGSSPLGIYHAIQSTLQLFDSNRLVFHNANVIDYPLVDACALLVLQDDSGGYESTLTTNTRFQEIYFPVINTLDTKDEGPTPYRSAFYIDATMPHELFLQYTSEKKCSDPVLLAENSLQVPSLTSLGSLFPKYQQNVLIRESGVLGVNGFSTWKYDEADLLTIKQKGFDPMVFMDYSLMSRSENMDFFGQEEVWPYKLKTACLFDPFSNQILPEVYTAFNMVIIPSTLNSIWDRIRIQTASDFLWNPDVYNPELSLYRALVSEFDTQTAWNLIHFNHYYFKLRAEITLAYTNNRANKYLRRIDDFLKQLNKYQNQLVADNTGNLELVIALVEKVDEIEHLIQLHQLSISLE